jgi:hypothetical protein
MVGSRGSKINKALRGDVEPARWLTAGRHPGLQCSWKSRAGAEQSKTGTLEEEEQEKEGESIADANDVDADEDANEGEVQLLCLTCSLAAGPSHDAKRRGVCPPPHQAGSHRVWSAPCANQMSSPGLVFSLAQPSRDRKQVQACGTEDAVDCIFCSMAVGPDWSAWMQGRVSCAKCGVSCDLVSAAQMRGLVCRVARSCLFR